MDTETSEEYWRRVNHMELSQRQLREFVDQGFLRVPGVVPPLLLDRALKAIGHSLGEGFPPEQAPTYRARSFCPEITGSSEIVDLATRSPAWYLLESLLGQGNIRPISGGQIALRFPMLNEPERVASPHLDGMYSPLNGVTQGTIHGFSLLLGVVLRDIDTDYAGNLMVWPRSHHLHAQYFRDHGWDSLLQGMPPVDRGEPVHVTAKAGDITLAHYLLGHGTAPNLSPNIRYTVYFRVYHKDHDSAQSAVSPWRDFPGLVARLPELAP